LVNFLHQKEIHFKSITDQVDTSTPSGRFFFHVMASLAQMERELVAERTKAGLAAARAQGRIGGRKRKMTQSKIESAKKLLASVYYQKMLHMILVYLFQLYIAGYQRQIILLKKS